MTQKKPFWQVLMAGLLLFYAYAAFMGLTHGLMQRPVLLALAFFAAHVLEMPIAFRKLKALNPDPARVMVATFVFGLVWWIPASRGLIAVR